MDKIRKDYELFARSEYGIGSNKLNEYDKYLIKTNGGYIEPYIHFTLFKNIRIQILVLSLNNIIQHH